MIGRLLASQAKSGAFVSTVHLPDGSVQQRDENGFVTALAVFELQRLHPSPAAGNAIARALDFLERCEAGGKPGHFLFYPEDAHPGWMRTRLHPDADDTALFATLLVRHGRRPASFLDFVADEVLERHRLRYRAEWCPPWFRTGAYFTWLRSGYPRNPVDCCVNTNVLAMRSLTANRSGLAEVAEMICGAVDWAGELEARARMVSPWYPNPVEFAHAVRRAVSLGTLPELEPVLRKIEGMPWSRAASAMADEGIPVCGSADGRFLWRCGALQAVRVKALD
jgi:hypothetical protein